MFSVEAVASRRCDLRPSPRLDKHVHYLPTAKRRKPAQYQEESWSDRISLQRLGDLSLGMRCSCFLSEASVNCGICCSPPPNGQVWHKAFFLGGSGRRAGAHTRPPFPKMPTVSSAFSLLGSPGDNPLPPPEGGKSLGGRPPEAEGNLQVPRHTRLDPFSFFFSNPHLFSFLTPTYFSRNVYVLYKHITVFTRIHLILNFFIYFIFNSKLE